MLAGTQGGDGIVRQPDLRYAPLPRNPAARRPKVEVLVVKASFPVLARQIVPILRYQMQKEPGIGVRRGAIIPHIAQLFALRRQGHLEIGGSGRAGFRRPPGRRQGGNRPTRAGPAAARQRRRHPLRHRRRQQFIAPRVQMAAFIPIQNFRMVGENPGQVKVVDALALQIPVELPQQRIAPFHNGFIKSVRGIGRFPFLRAQRLGRRRILIGL